MLYLVAAKRYVITGCFGIVTESPYSRWARFSSCAIVGEKFDSNPAALGPVSGNHLAAAWVFCSSPEYAAAVFEIDHNLKASNVTLVKVSFGLEHWTKVAAECFPNGLPKPNADDRTQWIFHGDSCQSVLWDKEMMVTVHGPTRFDHSVFQVAVAPPLGFRWSAEFDPEMRLTSEQYTLVEGYAINRNLVDTDGIVCLSPVRGKINVADRWRSLLIRAYGQEWSANTEQRLVAATAQEKQVPNSLEVWLQDPLFAKHCKLFHNRPFIWYIWDGRPDGFHSIDSYHRLAGCSKTGQCTLKWLTYAYLKDWIERRRRAEQREGLAGAYSCLVHALDAQRQLERILEGQLPCDLFVRWKSFCAQPMSWTPDINDGVQLNIRPFMRAELREGGSVGASILRFKPNARWGKDRGQERREPRQRRKFPRFYGFQGGGSIADRTDFVASENSPFDGKRRKDLHSSRAEKEQAREARQAQTTVK